MTVHLFTTELTEYFKPTVENHFFGIKILKKIPFRILLLINNVPGHSRALVKMYNEINVMPTNTAFILKPVVQGVILIFKP